MIIKTSTIGDSECREVLNSTIMWLQEQKESLGIKITHPTDSDIQAPNNLKASGQAVKYNTIVGTLHWIEDSIKNREKKMVDPREFTDLTGMADE